MNELRAGAPVTVGGVRITPLERVRVEGAADKRGLFLYASKTAVGIVISAENRDWALDLEGNAISLGTVPEGIDEGRV